MYVGGTSVSNGPRICELPSVGENSCLEVPLDLSPNMAALEL